MIYCRQCGKELNDNATFCTDCGAPVQSASPYAAPTPAYPMMPAPYPQSTHITFANSYLGIVMLAVLLFISLIAGTAASSMFVSPMNLLNILQTFLYSGLLALAVSLTARSKGPDLSVGSTITLSGILVAKTVTLSGSLIAGLLLALVICAAIGALNGVLTVYLKLPAIVVTAVMFFVVWSVCRMVSGSQVLFLKSGELQAMSHSFVIPVLLLLVCFGGVFVLIARTKLGVPLAGREKDKSFVYVLAYLVSGVLSALAGLLLMARLQVVVPYLGYDKLIFAIFVAGCAMSSRLFDSRYLPAVIAIGAALIWSVISNVLNILSIDAYIQLMVNGIIAIAFAAIAFVNWRNTRKLSPGIN